MRYCAVICRGVVTLKLRLVIILLRYDILLNQRGNEVNCRGINNHKNQKRVERGVRVWIGGNEVVDQSPRALQGLGTFITGRGGALIPRRLSYFGLSGVLLLSVGWGKY
jgi:hypothetical protein